MSGVFKYTSTLKPDAYQRLKRGLVRQSVGLHNAHTPLLLEGGDEYFVQANMQTVENAESQGAAATAAAGIAGTPKEKQNEDEDEQQEQTETGR